MPPPLNAEHQRQVIANLGAFHRTLDVLLAVGDLEPAASIATMLSTIWFSHRYILDGMHYLSAILNSPGADELSDAVLVTLCETYGMGAIAQGHYEQAEAYYRIALSKHVDTPRTILDLLGMIGATAYQRGQYDVAGEYCNKALVVARQLDCTEAVAHMQGLLGVMAGLRGNSAEYRDRLAYARALSEQRDSRMGLAISLNGLGEMERVQHKYRQAIDHYQASAALFAAERPAEYMVTNLNLAFSLLAVGDVSKAEALFTQGHRYWEAEHAPYKSALCLVGLAGVRIATRSYQQAARLLGRANQRFAHSDGSLDPADRLEYERIEELLQAHISQDELHSIQARVASEDCGALANGRAKQTGTAVLVGELSALSSRELEMLRLIAQGLTDKQIAVQCYISLHTVNNHLRAILRKLEVNTRSAAIHVAHQQGLL